MRHKIFSLFSFVFLFAALAFFVPGEVSAADLSDYTHTGSFFENPNNGYTYEWAVRNTDNTPVLLKDGELDSDEFVSDGTYTYYCQADGSVMQDRLTYHPDGNPDHIIYFDGFGHEVFNAFTHASHSITGEPIADGEIYYFNVYGFMYKNTVTFDQTGTKLYYINGNGQMQHDGWFDFDHDAGYGDSEDKWEFAGTSYKGYANYDGNLVRNEESNYNGQGALMLNNGEMALDSDFPFAYKSGHIVYDTDPYINYMIEDMLRQAGVSDSMSDDEKIKTIYHWMLYNIKHDDELDYDKNYPAHYDFDVIESGARRISFFTDTLVNMGKAKYADIVSEAMTTYWVGVCGGVTSVFVAMCSHAGVDAGFCGGAYINRNGTRVGHYWPYAYVDGQQYFYDIDVEIKNLGKGQGDWYWYKKNRADAEKTHEFSEIWAVDE